MKEKSSNCSGLCLARAGATTERRAGPQAPTAAERVRRVAMKNVFPVALALLLASAGCTSSSSSGAVTTAPSAPTLTDTFTGSVGCRW